MELTGEGRIGPSVQRRGFLTGITAVWLAGLAGCIGSDGQNTPTGTPTPPAREFPYTAQSSEDNVSPRDLKLDNGTGEVYEASVGIRDIDAERIVLERTVTLDGGTDHSFEDIIGKTGTYAIHFELAVGTTKRYEWPIDGSHGDAGIWIREGERPTEPVVWYTIEDR